MTFGMFSDKKQTIFSSINLNIVNEHSVKNRTNQNLSVRTAFGDIEFVKV